MESGYFCAGCDGFSNELLALEKIVGHGRRGAELPYCLKGIRYWRLIGREMLGYRNGHDELVWAKAALLKRSSLERRSSSDNRVRYYLIILLFLGG